MLKNHLFNLVFFLTLFNFSVQNTFGQIELNVPNQIEEPITWKANVTKSDSLFTLAFIAELDKGWHLPSMRPLKEDEIGPIPTEFTFEEQEFYKLVGETSEPEGIETFDKTFGIDLKYFEKKVAFKQNIKITAFENPVVVDVLYSVCDDEKCLPPEVHTFRLQINPDGKFQSLDQNLEVKQEDVNLTNSLKLDLKNPELISSTQDKQSYAMLFFLGFIGGLLALLTPCVFPMIPLTVSFFTKGARTSRMGKINAFLYGLFIFGIYVLLSLPFHLLNSVNPEILNNISTNTVLNIIFFAIFMAFAFSFFGYYEITLPHSWSNRMDQKAMSFGGVIGIFFMALTLAIVSFSCTGPILGSLLGGSLTADGGAIQLSFGMGGFGLALALPFALFALFPNWLKALPQSGGWMNTVKVVLGFLEIGLAFKFLSNADLVENWGLLKREIFIGIWIAVGIALVLYLFGKIRFPHDAKNIRLSKGRVFTAVVFLAIVIYLIPGLTNTSYANLKLLSGFPPPLNYSLYEKDSQGPLGLKSYEDFDEGLQAAKASGKPILIDFTGMACVNCRKMEEQVWSEPEILETLKNEVILISLYVDKRSELPENEQFNFKKPNGDIKPIKTIGDKWATFQTVNFQNNSQPLYAMLDQNLKLLNKPTGYEPDADVFLKWLKSGIAEN